LSAKILYMLIIVWGGGNLGAKHREKIEVLHNLMTQPLSKIKFTAVVVDHVNMSGPGHGVTGDPGHGNGFLLFLSSLYSAIFLQGT